MDNESIAYCDIETEIITVKNLLFLYMDYDYKTKR